jgi:hypothetical protein
VRRGFLVVFIGLGLTLAAPSQGQTVQPAVPAAMPPATADPGPPPAIPAPVRESIDGQPVIPGYAQKPIGTETIPVPQPAPQPALLPAQVTAQTPYVAMPEYSTAGVENGTDDYDSSAYVPLDSWIYPAMLRLYSMGYVDTMYLSMRPYTRRSVLHMLKRSEDAILSGTNEQAQDILASIFTEFAEEDTANVRRQDSVTEVQSVYTRMMGINGQVLRDSYHLGQTIADDYGRPYQKGFNMVAGASSLAEYGSFSFYVRGEYQHSPGGAGYSQALSTQLSTRDNIIPFAPPNDPQATIPSGPVAGQNPFRLVEMTLSVHLLGHEISGGKSDAWLGPGAGGAMAWSNNAENIYAFRIDRIEPLNIKYVSRLLGPVRYNFFYGSLKGHSSPNDPYVHSEMFSFRPTVNFQFGFQRTIIFGGEGHEPVTIHTFLKGFFDTNDTNVTEKYSRSDPGARFSSFTFSYRLPFVRDYLTLYTDSETHDDLTPVSAPRRAAYRPGLYLSHFPGAKRLDMRVEGVSTDCSTLICMSGNNEYIETIQKQGYTNKGLILGDWIGREAKGGQAWMTYHLSANEWVGVEFMHKKTPQDFITGGVSQTQFKVDAVKRFGVNKDIEVNAWYQYERWTAPIYLVGRNTDSTTAVQVTWYPKLKGTR